MTPQSTSENPNTGQKEKMLAGQLYMATDPELSAAHLRAQAILATHGQFALLPQTVTGARSSATL